MAAIKKIIHPANINHCAGIENPADLPSRGLFPQQLKESKLWREGPEWLKDEELPVTPYTEPTETFANLSRNDIDEDLIKDFSSFNRLTKFVGLCNRWRERALLQVGPTREERIKLKAATKGSKAQAENCSMSLKDVRGAQRFSRFTKRTRLPKSSNTWKTAKSYRVKIG